MTNTEPELRDQSHAAAIDQLLALIDEHYVFPEISTQVRSVLTAQVSAGAYKGGDLASVAERVTADLQRTNGDRHLRLVHHDQAMPEEDDDTRDDAEMTARAETTNHGVGRIDRLEGGVGVLELTPLLFPPSISAEHVGAAFTQVHDVDALVLDLRSCFGGDPEMVAFACTYVFGVETVHLNDIEERGGRKTRQFWTLPYVPGRRFGADKPLHVATSALTFSGGEEFAYNLQQLGRAVVVGETTRGGAHPRRGFRLTAHLEAHIPVARAVNPHSGLNWETVGVKPDVPTSAGDALDEAIRLARAALG